MRKLIIFSALALTALSATGCNSCGRPRWNLFNRGSECCEPPCMSADAGGWIPRTSGMVEGPAMLPGPIEVTPVN